jgi:phosphoribosylformimino-5-aminoimidazole carboxamide ribotide isomerase
MIEIIPSLSIYQGKCVKVAPGDFDHLTVYGNDPLEVAQEFEDQGIKRISLIDLDGAKAGEAVNYDILEMLARYTDLSIDFSGGINSEDDVRTAFECGAKHIAAASIAARNPEVFASWVVSYGRERIILVADAKEGKVITGGWIHKTEIDLMTHIEYFYERGIKYVKCTDVSRDGSLSGPSIDLYQRIMAAYPEIQLIASGGVSSVQDIISLQEIGVYGVMFGRAYYEKKINLQALQASLQQSAAGA